jgi:uncharacterized protein (DUF1778 family)
MLKTKGSSRPKEGLGAKKAKAMSRLEARIPTPLYETMTRAAKLRGLTLTAYVIVTMSEHARRTIAASDTGKE